MQSPDNSVTPETSIGQFNSTIVGLAQEMNQEMDPGPKLEGWMKDSGFQEITVKRCPLPMGTWPKDKHLVRLGLHKTIPY